jgi:inhibitor of KinA
MPGTADPAPLFRWISDRHLAITWPEDDPTCITRCWNHLSHALHPLAAHAILDIIPSQRAVTLLFDPCTLNPALALDTIRAALNHPWHSTPSSSTLYILPACYDPSLAPDLLDLARHAQRSIHDLITLHASTEFSVRYIGFAPGFPYLAGLPALLHMPRLDHPRPSVAKGSIAIAGDQAGIYPAQSPGGWRIIARTPATLFDHTRSEPCLLRPGDRIRFAPISLDEFHHATLAHSPTA